MRKIRIGAQVFCQEGEEAGEVDIVVMDPRSGQVTGVIVREQGNLTRDVVVPIDRIREVTESGVYLRLAVRDLEALPDYVETEYVSPEPSAPPSGDYPHQEVVLPVARACSSDDRFAELMPGKPVECHGEYCGMVDDVFFDPTAGNAVSFRLRHSGNLTRDVVVPVEWVLDARGERVLLDCNVGQLEEELPPAQVTEEARA